MSQAFDSFIVVTYTQNQFFAKKLAELMEKKRVTQVELAKALNKSQPTISDYLSGKIFPRLIVLMQLAKYFSVTLFDLTGLESLKDIEKKAANTQPTEEEKALLEKYKSLPEDHWLRKAIDQVLLENKPEKKEGEK